MANKGKRKKRLMTGTDIALAVLAALGGSVLFMTVVLVAGSIMFPDSGRSAAADAPPARPSYYGTLPSRAPTREPTPEPTESIAPDDTGALGPAQTPSEAVPDTPVPSQAPAQTQPPSRTQAPSIPVPTRAPTPTRGPAAQNPGPVASINPTAPPTRQTQAPAQAGNQGGAVSGDRTAKFAAGKALATTASNNNNDPVYHTTNCRSAQRIAASDEYWYDSAQAAEAAGRRLCGNCAR